MSFLTRGGSILPWAKAAANAATTDGSMGGNLLLGRATARRAYEMSCRRLSEWVERAKEGRRPHLRLRPPTTPSVRDGSSSGSQRHERFKERRDGLCKS